MKTCLIFDYEFPLTNKIKEFLSEDDLEFAIVNHEIYVLTKNITEEEKIYLSLKYKMKSYDVPDDITFNVPASELVNAIFWIKNTTDT